ncbi:crotonyl-CoA carboxylase/reductase [Streptantibioticus ferralitis]|uniref:Crotonyl-CoA carboxylase/reductase n=1 Tax=Streptantibioticus ferralitis TaxID=236510 RepID=A0ABT5ZC40_9ACTN|nr:crotonyl-CoA carboxylase/reductase [Streptantibioticus ferralitis]MDF2261416.1 crotonyl-CoA carboxylase/reductase [Streptantibioticus ferralitis]
MEPLTEAVLQGADPDELSRIPVPAEFLAAHLRQEDADIFVGATDKDVRSSLRVGRVAMPELAPDEVLLAVMASSINYNTVWSATFEPVSTFDALKRMAKAGRWDARHDQPFHVVGSDAAGIVVRTGAAVRRWAVGDRVSVCPLVADTEDPMTHADSMLSDMRAWGYETNFGGLAQYAVVRSSQLMPKPAHLTWEEAACIPLCGGTAYRMLIGDRGARMKQGDVVLIWGASGGLGSFAVQMVKNGGGIPVGVVSSEYKADLVRKLGCDVVINRQEIGIGVQPEPGPPTVKLAKRLGRAIRQAVGEDPHIVFDYVGKATFGLSVIVARRGGSIVTCGSTSGFEHNFDNRYFWMNLKRVIGSHGMNLSEATETMRLSRLGKLAPALSAVYPLAEAAEATRLVQTNAHTGKVGVLCMAPEPGLGVTDHQLRARLGEQWLNPLRSMP